MRAAGVESSGFVSSDKEILQTLNMVCSRIVCYGEREDDSIRLFQQKISRTKKRKRGLDVLTND